jgi:hypothetical protein
MKFYRYEAKQYTSLLKAYVNVKLLLIELNLHKETLKGYWIGYGYVEEGKLRSTSKWVSKTARKRYAYPTKEEALTNYIKRTQRRVSILKNQLEVTERGLEVAKELELV